MMGHDAITPFDWSKRSVLIGILRDAIQLDLNLEHRFYHIPKALLAVRPEEVRYVALYQSKRLFGEQHAGIRFYGRVAAADVLPRRDIVEIPPRNNGEELYCRFEIENWETLQKPVKAAGLTPGVSMLTSMFLLTHCRRVPELFLRTEESWELYRTLQAAAVRTYRSGGSELLETAGDKTVMIAGQTIGVYHIDGHYEEYNLREFLYNPHGFMTRMHSLFGTEDGAGD